MRILGAILGNALALLATTVVPGITFTGSWLTLVFAGALFAFLSSWDEVVVSIFMTTTRFRTLPVVMWVQVRQVVDPTVAAVATVLLATTTIVLTLALVVRRQRPVR